MYEAFCVNCTKQTQQDVLGVMCAVIGPPGHLITSHPCRIYSPRSHQVMVTERIFSCFQCDFPSRGSEGNAVC